MEAVWALTGRSLSDRLDAVALEVDAVGEDSMASVATIDFTYRYPFASGLRESDRGLGLCLDNPKSGKSRCAAK